MAQRPLLVVCRVLLRAGNCNAPEQSENQVIGFMPTRVRVQQVGAFVKEEGMGTRNGYEASKGGYRASNRGSKKL